MTLPTLFVTFDGALVGRDQAGSVTVTGVNSPGYVTGPVVGTQAVLLTSTSYVTVPSAGHIDANQGEIVFRFQPNAANWYANDGLFRNLMGVTTGAAGSAFNIYRGSTAFILNDRTNTATWTHGIAAGNTDWRTLSFSWAQGDNLRLFEGATQRAQSGATLASPVPVAANLSIGQASNNAEAAMFEVLVFGVPLTLGERGVLASAPRWRYDMLDGSILVPLHASRRRTR